MKFTSEDLMKAMGLSVGDRVKVMVENNPFKFMVILNGKNQPYLLGDRVLDREITILLDKDFEILPRPKRVGDLKCDDFECCDCPLKYICRLCDWDFKTNNNLFNILEKFNCDDQEIHDLLKARLDKEVE